MTAIPASNHVEIRFLLTTVFILRL